ncbi:unnamed protein product [Hydatigera taeniaeformis]|uniref:t-SNARE coiled-coil homology domain-containing protein n=1 Tax=Hydatigena taeniaeformis TaxID=6205 RepID=A0A0R3X4E1_HYDTA|nr:unnamed protein product [Hydatigera taeniaeformis]
MAMTGDVASDISKIELDIHGIKQQIDQFEEILKSAESGHTSVSTLNEKYHEIILSTKDLSQHLKALRGASYAPGVSDEVRARARNLHEQAINQTTRIQRIGRETQRISAARSRAAAAASQGPTGAILDPKGGGTGGMQQMLQMQDDEQTAREMEALEADIIMINELFTTLATYVHDQGEIVDSIEANTEAAYVQVQSGVQQLHTAVQHRRSARRRKCMCALVLVVAVIIVGLIVGLSLRDKG